MLFYDSLKLFIFLVLNLLRLVIFSTTRSQIRRTSTGSNELSNILTLLGRLSNLIASFGNCWVEWPLLRKAFGEDQDSIETNLQGPDSRDNIIEWSAFIIVWYELTINVTHGELFRHHIEHNYGVRNNLFNASSDALSSILILHRLVPSIP